MNEFIPNIRAGFRMFLFALNCLWVIPSQSLMLLMTKGPASYVMPRLWQKLTAMIFNIRVETVGTPYTGSQTLYIANHMSYADIPALGGIIKGSFVAKKELRGWPLFGFLSTLQQTAFISRSRTDAQNEKNNLIDMMKAGKDLIIFPEGTSSDGTSVKPFKSSLFELPIELAKGNEKPVNGEIMLQPVTIRLMAVNDEPAEERDLRDLYCWYGDMTLEPHLLALARTRKFNVRIVFHPPYRAKDYHSRKELCKLCYEDVVAGLSSQA